MLMMDGVTLIMSLGVTGFLGWIVLTQLRTGELPTLMGPVIRRSEKPEMFWFGAWMAIAMAVFFFALALVTIGNMVGWWEISV